MSRATRRSLGGWVWFWDPPLTLAGRTVVLVVRSVAVRALVADGDGSGGAAVVWEPHGALADLDAHAAILGGSGSGVPRGVGSELEHVARSSRRCRALSVRALVPAASVDEDVAAVRAPFHAWGV